MQSFLPPITFFSLPYSFIHGHLFQCFSGISYLFYYHLRFSFFPPLPFPLLCLSHLYPPLFSSPTLDNWVGPAAGKERLDASLSKLLALVFSVIVPGFCVAVFVVVSVVCLGVVVRALCVFFPLCVVRICGSVNGCVFVVYGYCNKSAEPSSSNDVIKGLACG